MFQHAYENVCFVGMFYWNAEFKRSREYETMPPPSPMSGSPTFDIDTETEKANLKHALLVGGVINS